MHLTTAPTPGSYYYDPLDGDAAQRTGLVRKGCRPEEEEEERRRRRRARRLHRRRRGGRAVQTAVPVPTFRVEERKGRCAVRGNLPAQVLVEGVGAFKHAVHRGEGGCVPPVERLVERLRVGEHGHRVFE